MWPKRVIGITSSGNLPDARTYEFRRNLNNLGQNDDFPFINRSIRIFNYRGKFYFDAYPGWVRKKRESPKNADLVVYKREAEQTEIVCEYDWR